VPKGGTDPEHHSIGSRILLDKGVGEPVLQRDSPSKRSLRKYFCAPLPPSTNADNGIIERKTTRKGAWT
jgi:hypothetical protein